MLGYCLSYIETHHTADDPVQCDGAQCGAITPSHIEKHHTADDPVQCDAAQCGADSVVTLRRITLQMILCSVMQLNMWLTT